MTPMDVYLLLIGIAVVLSMYRVFRGPTAVDRLVAVDIMTTLTVGMMVLYALYYGRMIYLSVALVYAVLAFAGVIAFGRYLEGGL